MSRAKLSNNKLYDVVQFGAYDKWVQTHKLCVSNN